jgi:hypothetical protein
LLVAVLVAGALVSCSSHHRAAQPACLKHASRQRANELPGLSQTVPRLSPTSERSRSCSCLLPHRNFSQHSRQ